MNAQIPDFPFSEWITSVTPPPPLAVSLLFLTLGAIIASTPYTWSKTRMLATWVHEASHATAAIISGRRVTGMKVHADTSGVTQHVGNARGFGRLFTAFAGYPGPAFLGIGICYAVGTSHVTYAVVGLLILSAVLLPVQRSLRGLTLTLLVGGTVTALVYFQSDPTLVTYGMLALGGYMLMASPRTIVELHYVRKHERNNPEPGEEPQHSDADSLARMTHTPAVMWEAIFMTASLGSVWVSINALLI